MCVVRTTPGARVVKTRAPTFFSRPRDLCTPGCRAWRIPRCYGLDRQNDPDSGRRLHEASRAGELLNQDTFYWGTLKGVGKVYVQVAVDVSCSFAFAKVYTSKMPITAVDLMFDRILPFYASLGVSVGAVLTDNGREFCGRPEQHPYELLLAMEAIEHRTTKVRCPRTNGFVERMNRTLLDECFRIQGRTKWYTTPEEIQADLDTFLAFYNFERTHQGYRVAGRTPAQALIAALVPSRPLLAAWPEAQEVAALN